MGATIVMSKTKILWFFLILVLGTLLLFPRNTLANQTLLHGRYSPGGYSISLWMDETYSQRFARAEQLSIAYCDGSSTVKKPGRYIRRIDLPLPVARITFHKPVERIVVFWKGDEQYEVGNATLRRECNDPAPDNNLYCNTLEVPHTFPRLFRGSITFTSQKNIRNAWFQLDDEHDMIPIYFLMYSPSTREWTGSMRGQFFPVGTYSNVFLVIQDEFDRQAKCRVGEFIILDWGG